MMNKNVVSRLLCAGLSVSMMLSMGSVVFADDDWTIDVEAMKEEAAAKDNKDIKLAYTLPTQWFSGTHKPNISLYVSGQNLITITSYSHYDPEASWMSSAVNGWDRGVYPSSKSFTLGLQVKF
jgi:hypothetical protein